MAYIGKEPIVGNFQKCDAITVVNGQAAYTLQVSSTNVTPESANHMLVSLNGILQAPVTSFTVSGATLTFASNLATGDVIDFVILLGNVLDLGTPSDGTVTNAKLAQDIISGETALASEPADTDEFLVSDAGTLKRIDYSLIKASGGLAEADQWRITATGTGVGVFTANWERNDTNFDKVGTGMSESSGIFTFPSTGIWKIDFQATGKNDAQTDYVSYQIETTPDNSTYSAAAYQYAACNTGNSFCDFYMSVIFDVTSTSTHKVRFNHNQNEAGTFEKSSSTDAQVTGATFLKLGDT